MGTSYSDVNYKKLYNLLKNGNLTEFKINGHSFLCNSEINSLVDDFKIICIGNLLYVCPFLEYEGNLIFSDPCLFCIGEINDNGIGIIRKVKWESKMNNSNISEKIIQISNKYLDENKPLFLYNFDECFSVKE